MKSFGSLALLALSTPRRVRPVHRLFAAALLAILGGLWLAGFVAVRALAALDSEFTVTVAGGAVTVAGIYLYDRFRPPRRR